MIKQQLWILNSALVGLLVSSLGVHLFITQEIPTFSTRKRRSSRTTQPLKTSPIINAEKIYQNDLFDTYVPKPDATPQTKNLVTPLPPFNPPAFTPPPPPPKTEFLPPLDIKVKGIILSQDQNKSIALIEDQTGKQMSYFIGSKIQDGQILKLTQNKMVVLRSNGQQETFYLRKPDVMGAELASWDYAIKRIDDQLYHIDPTEITKEIKSIGEVIEALDLSDAYNGKVVQGLLIGSIEHHPLGKKIGLQKSDIITAVNNLPATNSSERVKIFDAIAALSMGEHIYVDVLRDEKPLQISYLLKRIEKIPSFMKGAAAADQSTDALFSLGRNNQQISARREFEHRHRTGEQHDAAVSEMRQRILTNMKERSHNRRVL